MIKNLVRRRGRGGNSGRWDNYRDLRGLRGSWRGQYDGQVVGIAEEVAQPQTGFSFLWKFEEMCINHDNINTYRYVSTIILKFNTKIRQDITCWINKFSQINK